VDLDRRQPDDEAAILADARRRGIALDGVNEHAARPQPPALAAGVAALQEPALSRALGELAAARASPRPSRPRGPYDYGE
jgi:hypothetical protein